MSASGSVGESGSGSGHASTSVGESVSAGRIIQVQPCQENQMQGSGT